MEIKTFFKEIFQQDDGGYSSKRVIMILCVLAMFVAFFANLFFQLKIDEFIFNSVRDIVIGVSGIAGLEKWLPKGMQRPTEGTQ